MLDSLLQEVCIYSGMTDCSVMSVSHNPVLFRTDESPLNNLFQPNIESLVFSLVSVWLSSGHFKLHFSPPGDKTNRRVLQVFISISSKRSLQKLLTGSGWGQFRYMYIYIDIFDKYTPSIQSSMPDLSLGSIFREILNWHKWSLGCLIFLLSATFKLVSGHKPAQWMYKSNGNWETEKTPPGLCRYLQRHLSG